MGISNRKSAKQNNSSSDSDLGDNLYLDDSDERRLNLLPEKEKEQILFKRSLEIQKMREKRFLDKKLGYKEKEETKIDTLPKPKEDFFEVCCKIQIKKEFMISNIYKPFFNSFIGHLVRLKKDSSYYLCTIKNIYHGPEVYEIPDRKIKKNIKTDLLLDLFNGERIFTKIRILYISDTSITEDEYVRFRQCNDKFNFAEREYSYKSLVHRMTREMDVNEQIKSNEERRSFYYSTSKKNTLTKIKLIRERDEAIESKNFNKAQDKQKEIDKLDALDDQNQSVWASVTEKNKRANAEKARLYEMSKKKQ